VGIGRKIGTGVSVVGLVLGAVGAASAAPPEEGRSPQTARPGGTTVTLITGDRVTMHDTNSISIMPGEGREKMTFSRLTARGHVYVIPNDARKLVSSGQVDRRLFDVTTLVDFGYDDARRASVPLIVTHVQGQPTPRLAGNSRELPSIDGVAVAAPKNDAGAVWESLTEGASDGLSARSAARGVAKVWLDGKREAILDRSAEQIHAPAAWEAGLTGDGVRVAVLDTGVDQTHPDLAGREVVEENFSESPDNVDNFGHGTHVASILAGTGAKSGGKYRGIAHGAQLLDGKVLSDDGFGTDSGVIAGMEWAVAQDADVVNLSLGGMDTAEVDPLEQAVETLSAQHGTLFVIAAGNGIPEIDPVASPGSAPSALTVGAVDRDDAMAGFSLGGPVTGSGDVKPDLTAPGVGIVAALHSAGTIAPPVEDGYTALSGTSMATPHVAGAAALLAQQHPDWSGQRLKAALMGSTEATAGQSVFFEGSGRVDVAQALAASVVAEPASVSMGVQAWPREDDEPVTKTITYRNLGQSEVTLDLAVNAATDPNGDPASDVFTLSADKITVPAGGTASATVTGDPSGGATDGSYSATVVATSSANTVTRTPVGITREGEHHTLTLNYTDDPAFPNDLYLPAIIGLDNDVSEFPAAEDGSLSLRLPKGKYLVDHVALSLSANRFTQLAQPGVLLDRDRTIDIDLAAAKPNSVTPPRDAQMALAEIAYSLTTGDSSFGSGVILGDLSGVATGQLGDPLPGSTMRSWLSSFWRGEADDVYNLAWFFERYPSGFTKTVRQRELATVNSEIGANPRSDVGVYFWRPLPASGTAFTGGLGFEISIPEDRVNYVTTDRIRWSSSLVVIVNDFESIAEFDSPARTFHKGQTYDTRLNVPVFGPGLPKAGNPWAVRREDGILVTVPLFTDGGGNAGLSETETASTKLFLGDELVGETPGAGRGFFGDLPAAARDYRLTTEATRPAYDLTSEVSVEWTFRSSDVEDVEDEVAVPLNVVRYQPRLDADGAAPSGRAFLVPVRVQDETGATQRPKRLTVEASYDEGKTWQRVPVTASQDAVLNHPAGAGSVSLRASATDRDGNTVKQTLIRAYKLR
jgi:subtilisin family serine protease